MPCRAVNRGARIIACFLAARHSTGNQFGYATSSVADTACLSRIQIFIRLGSRIPDPGSSNSKEEEGEKISCPTVEVGNIEQVFKVKLKFLEIFYSQWFKGTVS